MQEIAFSEFSEGQTEAVNSTSDDVGPNLPAAAEVTSPRSLISPRETLDFQLKANGLNKLLEAAIPILGLSVRIRNMPNFGDVNELHSRVQNEMQNFQLEMDSLGFDDATTLAARYCLCSMIDESVLSQPWGADSLWPERPMLSVFHNETWGGEKVFGILDRVMDEAHRFPDLLEFVYFCIALGFEGKYHVMHNGQAKLDHLLSAIYKILEKNSGESPDVLVFPEPNIYVQKQRMNWRIPVWSILFIGLILVALLHIYFDQDLKKQIATIGDEIGASLGAE